MAALFVLLIRFYQLTLSKLLVALVGPICRFEPSCSRYAILWHCPKDATPMEIALDYCDTFEENIRLFLRDKTSGASVDVLIALLRGAFVGLIKASRLGYLKLDDTKLEQAGAACWQMIAPRPNKG